MEKRLPLKEYLAKSGRVEWWEPIKKVCFDGKVRAFKPRGDDCVHFGYGIGGSVKCAAFPNDPKHGCPAMGCPWRCKYFQIRKSCG